MQKFEEKLLDILEVDEISDTDELENFDVWDSLTILSIIATVNELFGFTLSAAEIQNAGTISGLKKMIKSKR